MYRHTHTSDKVNGKARSENWRRRTASGCPAPLPHMLIVTFWLLRCAIGSYLQVIWNNLSEIGYFLIVYFVCIKINDFSFDRKLQEISNILNKDILYDVYHTYIRFLIVLKIWMGLLYILHSQRYYWHLRRCAAGTERNTYYAIETNGLYSPLCWYYIFYITAHLEFTTHNNTIFQNEGLSYFCHMLKCTLFCTQR